MELGEIQSYIDDISKKTDKILDSEIVEILVFGLNSWKKFMCYFPGSNENIDTELDLVRSLSNNGIYIDIRNKIEKDNVEIHFLNRKTNKRRIALWTNGKKQKNT